jgi:hypothetical protein
MLNPDNIGELSSLSVPKSFLGPWSSRMITKKESLRQHGMSWLPLYEIGLVSLHGLFSSEKVLRGDRSLA